MSVLDIIIDLRGGIPQRCDFCGTDFTEANYATPEEGGEWACVQCVRAWDAQEKRND